VASLDTFVSTSRTRQAPPKANQELGHIYLVALVASKLVHLFFCLRRYLRAGPSRLQVVVDLTRSAFWYHGSLHCPSIRGRRIERAAWHCGGMFLLMLVLGYGRVGVYLVLFAYGLLLLLSCFPMSLVGPRCPRTSQRHDIMFILFAATVL